MNTSFTLSSVANASGSPLVTVYTGTITEGASNAYVGWTFSVTGFLQGANNGIFVCTASTASTLTLANMHGVAETHSASATGGWVLSCKELSGSIYITRSPRAIINSDGTVEPGIPDNWYFIGPGTNPSVSKYGNTTWLVMFTYLSHINVRVVDIAVWPPTEVVPISAPPFITIGSLTSGSGAPQDSLTLKTEGGASLGEVAQFFKPPLLATPLLFLDPTINTYSVTILPLAGWAPDPPAGVQVFYRFYVRPFPYTGPWILTTDWTLSNASFPWFSFPFSHVGNLRDQFSVTWGTQFLATDQWNTNAHAEGIPGQFFVTVDSTTERANAQELINEPLMVIALGAPFSSAPFLPSDETFGFFGQRTVFHVIDSGQSFPSPGDSLVFGQRLGIGFLVPLVGDAELALVVGTRVGFVQPSAVPESLTFSAFNQVEVLQPNAYRQGCTLFYAGVRV